jgi:hypothetical protein
MAPRQTQNSSSASETGNDPAFMRDRNSEREDGFPAVVTGKI